MLTSQEITNRLKIKMGESHYNDLSNVIEQEFNKLIAKEITDNDIWDKLYYKYAYPQIKQHGHKVEIKTRKITLDCSSDISIFKFNSDFGKSLQQKLKNTDPNFNKLEFVERYQKTVELGIIQKKLCQIDHYSLWINGNIYHWGPGQNWRMYGTEETNKESVNEWSKTIEYNDIYFTLYTQSELNKYCDDWKIKNKFSYDNSHSFIKNIVSHMGLLDFSL
jgi:hypothetical protein